MAFEALNEKLKGKKSAKGSGTEKKNSGVGEFFRKNPFIKYLIPVLIFLIMAAVFLVLTIGDGVLSEDYGSESTTGVSAGNTAESVAVLPADENIKDSVAAGELYELIEKDPISEDILIKAVYKGCTIGSSGLRAAIVENSGTSFTLMVGDTLGKSQWKVTEITEESITFSSGTTTKVLYIK